MPLEERLGRSVVLWYARHRVSARRFETEALGDPGFVGTQARGRLVKLQTADRVLVFMGYPPAGPALKSRVHCTGSLRGMHTWFYKVFYRLENRNADRLNSTIDCLTVRLGKIVYKPFRFGGSGPNTRVTGYGIENVTYGDLVIVRLIKYWEKYDQTTD